MPQINYKYGSPEIFTVPEKEIICDMLIKQGKVENPSLKKINSFKIIGVCFSDGEIVSIGAVKPQTTEDFKEGQANIPELCKEFTWELGSCYTKPDYTGKGYSSAIVKNLVEHCNEENLTAATELNTNNPMMHILVKAGFKQYGNSWKAS